VAVKSYQTPLLLVVQDTSSSSEVSALALSPVAAGVPTVTTAAVAHVSLGRGWGQMLGVQTPAMAKVPVQAPAPRTTEHEPSVAQQEPEGCVQVLGVQMPPIVKVPVQATAPRTTVQLPLVAQQEPEGSGQGVGLQVILAVQVPVQRFCVPMRHAPLVWQQAPSAPLSTLRTKVARLGPKLALMKPATRTK